MSSTCSPNRSSGVDSRTWLNTLQGCCWNEPSCLSRFRCTNNVTQTGHRRFNSRYFYAHVAQSSVTVLLNSVSTSDFSHWFIWQFKNGANVFSISLLCHVCIHSCPCSVVTFKQGLGLVKINHMWLCHSHLMVQPVFCVDFWRLRLYIPFGSNDSGVFLGCDWWPFVLQTVVGTGIVLHAERLLRLSAAAVIWNSHCDLVYGFDLSAFVSCFTLIWLWYLSFVPSLQTCHACDFHVLAHLLLFHMTLHPGIVY